jgi:signal transduction histidine kinase
MNSSHPRRRLRAGAAFFKAARRQARQLQLLQNASHQIAAALDVDVVLERLVEAIYSSLGYRLVSAALVEGDYLVFRNAMATPGTALVPLPDAIPLNGPGLTVWAVRSAAPALAGDVNSDARYLLRAEFSGTRSELAVPMRGRFEVLGVIDVQSDQPQAFDKGDLELLATLAEHAATAIENARLYEAARERSRELEQLYQNERMLLSDMENSYNELLQTLTELERRDEQLRRTEQLSVLGELASGVAHDFNNLLAGILGNIQLLLLDEIDAERRRMLGVIEQAAQDGATTVRRIQEFARQSERSVDDHVNLIEVIDGALAITRPRWHNLAQREGHAIRVHREIGDSRLVLGNAAELRELLINLIINAIDAMPNGGDLTLRLNQTLDTSNGPVWLRTERWVAVLEVADTGCGIPPVERERIFDSFYSTKPAGKGSGLGLAMCRQIAARHNGRIEVDSAPGQGTTFRILLPLADRAEPEAAVAPARAPVVGLRLLVVDDDASVRDVLGRILQRAGHIVTCLARAQDALAQFVPRQYDLIFTDLSLADMDGATFLREIRTLDPQITAVIVTGWGRLEENQHLSLGAAAVVSKPFSVSQILQLVDELASRDGV